MARSFGTAIFVTARLKAARLRAAILTLAARFVAALHRRRGIDPAAKRISRAANCGRRRSGALRTSTTTATTTAAETSATTTAGSPPRSLPRSLPRSFATAKVLAGTIVAAARRIILRGIVVRRKILRRGSVRFRLALLRALRLASCALRHRQIAGLRLFILVLVGLRVRLGCEYDCDRGTSSAASAEPVFFTAGGAGFGVAIHREAALQPAIRLAVLRRAAVETRRREHAAATGGVSCA